MNIYKTLTDKFSISKNIVCDSGSRVSICLKICLQDLMSAFYTAFPLHNGPFMIILYGKS